MRFTPVYRPNRVRRVRTLRDGSVFLFLCAHANPEPGAGDGLSVPLTVGRKERIYM
ncbi:uncharacterized protein HHUB_3176 [Halobacterium hubeiense]|uniref:Uncharacterized protein n=1 Tax=Halobacterium hubeiense TaxID=1407499 RepID=A0A0U5H7H7_9EURY|nr:uncharacterized protein HHUB_3176 [Halobacterium hubeiense]